MAAKRAAGWKPTTVGRRKIDGVWYNADGTPATPHHFNKKGKFFAPAAEPANAPSAIGAQLIPLDAIPERPRRNGRAPLEIEARARRVNGHGGALREEIALQLILTVRRLLE